MVLKSCSKSFIHTTNCTCSFVLLMTQVMVLIQLLKVIRAQAPTNKVVLVSLSFPISVASVTLKPCSVACKKLRLSVTVKQRQPLVDKFNDPADPSFVSSRALVILLLTRQWRM